MASYEEEQAEYAQRLIENRQRGERRRRDAAERRTPGEEILLLARVLHVDLRDEENIPSLIAPVLVDIEEQERLRQEALTIFERAAEEEWWRQPLPEKNE